MRHWPFCFFVFTVLFSCEDRPLDYNPDLYLSPSEQSLFLSKALTNPNSPVHPKETLGGNLATIWVKANQQKKEQIRLELFYAHENTSYFLITLPSNFSHKRYAAGGKIELNEKGEILSFEEIFRTWKMAPDVLQARSYFLFDKMVMGEPLSPYYTENSDGVDFIEFPDNRTYFDKASRSWKTK